MNLVSEEFLCAVKRLITPSFRLVGMDSSGSKLGRKGAWVMAQFDRLRKRDYFRKVHLLVDLERKKILQTAP